MRIAPLLLGVSFAACAVDVSGEAGTNSGGKADGSGASHTLPGFDERLLVGSSDGKLSVVHVGATFSRKSVTLSSTLSPLVIRARDGKFFALFDSGRLAVIDGASAKVEHALMVGASPQDMEWAVDGALYISTGSRVVTLDAVSGAQKASLDLASLRLTGTVQTRRMLRLDTRLFVQVARNNSSGRPENGALAVIDTTHNTVEKVIELEGLNPDFDLVHDARREHLYVSCAGVRPSNTGVLVRVNTATLAIHDRVPARAGWQGIAQFADPFETLFMIYHTSTPTTSSHLFAFTVSDSGELDHAGDGSTIVDTFDGIDALATNESGTLVAMANHCAAGFCIGGAGINFIDATTQEVYPKLLKAQLGFEPTIIQFAR